MMPLESWSRLASMQLLQISSLLFRGFAYIFLRIVPVTWGIFLLPSLFLGYLSAYLLEPPPVTDEKRSLVHLDPFWRALLLSEPSPDVRYNRANLFINVLLLAFAVDLVAHPILDPAHDVTFTRIGAVSSDSVKISVRYPSLNATESEHALKLLWRESPAKSDFWRDGPSLKLTKEKDWVGTVKLAGLWPKSSYECQCPFLFSPLPFHLCSP